MRTPLLLILIGLTLLGGLLIAPSTTTNTPTSPQTVTTGRILMFVPYNDVWWTEYKVAYEALTALGYQVDVVSSNTGEAYSYGGGVDNAIQTSFAQFETLFATNFGLSWNAAWTAQNTIPLTGQIQDIDNLDNYDAIIMPGGKGTIAYHYDGTYSDLSPEAAPGTHVTTAAEVQAAAEKLNELINIALAAGKPVGAQCHGAPLVAFARIDGTAGSGFDNLGTSVLEGQYATGYPLSDGTVAEDYANLGITYLIEEKLVLDGPDAPHYDGTGHDHIVTTLDWYAETVSYFAQTMHNIITSYPTPAQQNTAISVLVFGGDEPHHYLPQVSATYLDLVNLLNDANDTLQITATGTDNPADITLANLQNYDLLLYFRHNTLSETIQNDIVAYVDGGGGLLGIHHAIYNHQDGKDILVDLFGGELPSSAQLNNELYLVYNDEVNHLLNVNMGHYISSYGVNFTSGEVTSTVEYTTPLGIPNLNLDGDGTHGYWGFTIEAPDELYVGNRFNDNVTFGSGINQINRLFSNNRFVQGSPNPNNGHYDTWGWTKLYDSGDETVGRIVYLQPGETNDRSFAHPAYQQVIKNAVVWLTVEAVSALNQPPTAVDDTYAIAVNTTLTATTPGVLTNDSDPDGDTLTVTAHQAATNGSLTIAASGALTYTPATDFSGSEVVTYTISDGNGESDSATITITVSAFNQMPMAVADSFSVTEDSTANTLTVLNNDTDPDEDTLTISAVGSTTNGGIVSNAGDSLSYTPLANFYGTETFTYTISDGEGGSATTDVTVTVTPVNDPPQAVDDTATTPQDTPRQIFVLGNDTDPEGDTLTVIATGNPASGSATTNSTAVTYTPNNSYTGLDVFTYTISDGDLTASATITVDVGAVNNAPVADDDAVTIPQDTPITLSVLTNDSDPDADTITIISVGVATNGATAHTNNSVSYTPAPSFVGTDSFTYTISDGLATATATVNLTVTAVIINSPPVFDSTPITRATVGEVYSYTITASDPDSGDNLTISTVTHPAWLTFQSSTGTGSGSIIVNPQTAPLTGTPGPGDVGDHAVQLTVTDGDLNATQSFTITVAATPESSYYLYLPVVLKN